MTFTGSIEITLDPVVAGVVFALADELAENQFLAPLDQAPRRQAVSIVANHAEGLSRLIELVPTGALSRSMNLDESLHESVGESTGTCATTGR